MSQVTISVKSAGPAATHQVEEQIRVSGSTVMIRWPNFMLPTPTPAKPDK
jgi:hypothetical protein